MTMLEPSTRPKGEIPEDHPSELRRCLHCRDTKWVEVENPDGTLASVKPCSACNPVQRQLWEDQCLRGAGICNCDRCIGRRNGPIIASDIVTR